jgi:spore germination protein KA
LSLRSIYQKCFDVVFRPFVIGGNKRALLVYIEGLSNVEEIDESVLAPLQENAADLYGLEETLEKKISASSVKKVDTIADCVTSISSGNPVLLVDQESYALSLGLAKWKERAIDEPSAEIVLRGPREGFIETLQVNTSLLRRIIKSPALKMETMTIGSYTRTNIVIAYIEGLADQTLVDEVKNRIQRIEIDAILESGYIEELIEDNSYSPFPQVHTTERPDVASANLLEGRVVMLVDGTPFSLVVPTTLFTLLQSSEDYNHRFLTSSAIRWLRYLFTLISLFLPSSYVAILTFHEEMLPTELLISIASSRETVPFPALVEALLMELSFEALREAGVRLPKQVGAAISIVGALVIGQAAVAAGLVSPAMVMVVAITGIASFMVPYYSLGFSIRLLRFPLVLLAGTLGLLGTMIGIIGIVVHLCSLRSFGVPYLTPMAPLKSRELKDVLIRAPRWAMKTRPHLTGKYDKYRQSPGQKPGPTRNRS